MVKVSQGDLETLNRLTAEGDETRRKLTATLLTIYAVLSSGIFLFVSSDVYQNSNPSISLKISLFLTAISSTGIVFVSALEKIVDYFAKVQIGKSHAKNVREGTTSTPQSPKLLSPNNLTVSTLTAIPWTLFFLVILSAVSASAYMCILIFAN